MAKNTEIEVGAKAVAEDFRLPGSGRKMVARLVTKHLDWFDAAAARGMTLDDVIDTLATAGVRRKNGLPLSRGTLSSALWRKRNEALEMTQEDNAPRCRPIKYLSGRPNARPRHMKDQNPRRQNGRTSEDSKSGNAIRGKLGEKPADHDRLISKGARSHQAGSAVVRSMSNTTSSDTKGIRASMDRAARLRRGQD